MHIENKLSKDSTMSFTYLVWYVQLYSLLLHIKEVLLNFMMQNLLNKFNKEEENTLISEIIIPIDKVSNFCTTQEGSVREY